MEHQNHVCSLYTELKAVLKTHARTMALFNVARTLSLAAKLLEDSFVLAHKACIVKILGFGFFVFQLSSILPNAHTSMVVNPPLYHCRHCFHETSTSWLSQVLTWQAAVELMKDRTVFWWSPPQPESYSTLCLHNTDASKPAYRLYTNASKAVKEK